MTLHRFKRLAASNGCEVWYESKWKTWALRRVGASGVESSGGSYLSPGQIATITEAQLLERFILPAVNHESKGTNA